MRIKKGLPNHRHPPANCLRTRHPRCRTWSQLTPPAVHTPGKFYQVLGSMLGYPKHTGALYICMCSIDIYCSQTWNQHLRYSILFITVPVLFGTGPSHQNHRQEDEGIHPAHMFSLWLHRW